VATGKKQGKPERILAIDVGGTGLKAAIIGADGHMESERLRVATPHPCTPEQLVDTLAQLVAPLAEPPPFPASCATTAC
jgi:polyphosphate glucokinase